MASIRSKGIGSKDKLDTGQLDAIAAYKHEAVAKGLSYVTLPQQGSSP